MKRIAMVGTLMTALLAGGQAFANHPSPAVQPAISSQSFGPLVVATV